MEKKYADIVVKAAQFCDTAIDLRNQIKALNEAERQAFLDSALAQKNKLLFDYAFGPFLNKPDTEMEWL